MCSTYLDGYFYLPAVIIHLYVFHVMTLSQFGLLVHRGSLSFLHLRGEAGIESLLLFHLHKTDSLMDDYELWSWAVCWISLFCVS